MSAFKGKARVILSALMWPTRRGNIRQAAKSPTSRKEREKWGTPPGLIVDNWSAAFVTLINLVLA